MSDTTYLNPLSEEASPSDFVNLGSLAEDMVYRLPGCADLMIRKTLQAVYGQFCKDTWALRATSVSEIVEGEASYRIVIPSQTYIFRVVRVMKGDARLREGVHYTALTGEPVRIVLESVPTDSDAGVELNIEVVCVPTRGSEDIPTWFASMYGDALVSGAMFRLLAMGGRPWSDEAQARFEGIAWQNALNEASAKSIAGSQSGNRELNTINYGGML